MLGAANDHRLVALDESLRHRIRGQQFGLLAGSAALTDLAVAKGDINKWTGASVPGFIGLLAYAAVTDG